MTNNIATKDFARTMDKKAESMPDFKIMTFENGVFPPEVLTYQTIVSKGRKLAVELRRNGIGRGDRFALLMRNHPEFVYSIYAASAIGAILISIDPHVQGVELQMVLDATNAKGILLTREFLPTVEKVISAFPQMRVIGVSCKYGMHVPATEMYSDLDEILAGPEMPPLFFHSGASDAGFLINFANGRTSYSIPKIVTNTDLSEYSLMAKAIWQYKPDDRLYTGLPLTQSPVQEAIFFPSLLLNIPSVFSRKKHRRSIWNLCRLYDCTVVMLSSEWMREIYNQPETPDSDLNPVRLLINSSTPVAICKDIEKRFGVLIHESYATTDGILAHKHPGVGPDGSFGKPFRQFLEMKIFRKDNTECNPGEVGEIVTRFLGPSTTGEVEWVRSGDMGHMDKDGWFFFDGRRRRLAYANQQ